MYLFLFTNYFLEVTTGILWWVTKKSITIIFNGVKYIFSKEDIEQNNIDIEKNYDSLSRDEIEILKKELKEIKELLVQKE